MAENYATGIPYRAFTDASRRYRKAKSIGMRRRQHYERIEPIAELPDLTAALTPVKMIIMCRRSKIHRFHRLKALFGDNTTSDG